MKGHEQARPIKGDRMMHQTRSRAAVILVLALWCFGGGGILTPAAEASPAKSLLAKKKKGGKEKSEDKGQKLKASQYHQMAMNLYKKGMYEEAVEYFLKAYEMDKDPSTMFNIGKCYDALYRYVDAYKYYSDYIATGDEERLEEAREAMAAIEKMPVMLKVVSDPEGAGVYIDGEVVKFQRTPVIAEVSPGKHAVVIEKDGFARVEREVEIPVGGEAKLEVELEKVADTSKVVVVEDGGKGKKKDKKAGEPVKIKKKVRKGGPAKVPFGIGVAFGATVSTTPALGSFIDGTLNLDFRIKQFTVGLGVDNFFFTDTYLLSAYPAAGYTLELPKNLSLRFSAGFGFAYLYAFKDGGSEEGVVLVEKGGHWDLVAHADVRLRYKAGPIYIQFIPVHVNVLTGIGSLEPPPLAQFAFLAGIVYEI
jgi:hypothetical protein